MPTKINDLTAVLCIEIVFSYFCLAFNIYHTMHYFTCFEIFVGRYFYNVYI